MEYGTQWHTQIIESVTAAGGRKCVAVASSSSNAWHSYLNSHLNEVPNTCLYAECRAGLVMLSFSGGYSFLDNIFAVIGEPETTSVLVVGWDQAEVDIAVERAQANGLTVVKSLRVEDNVKVLF